MTESTISRYDLSNMRKLLVEFPQQVRDAVAIGSAASVATRGARVKNIVVSGLGGSAIGGDLLRAYTAESIGVPFIVNRHYFLPEFVDESSLVVVASYSGNTEETLAVHKDAIRRKAQVVCISTNGELAQRAKRRRQPLITIPKGFPPRVALGYSFFPVLLMLHKMKLIPSPEREIRETVTLLDRLSSEYARLDEAKNPALRLAGQLRGKLPVVYSSADRFDVVNVRWRGQIAENAKVVAFGHVLPEMNHNELVGWSKSFHAGKTISKQMRDMAVIFLRDKEDHKRVQFRMEITKKVIAGCASEVIEVESRGKSLLARLFSLIYLGDWVSFYLAIHNGVDPTPVKVIDYLKNELGKV